MKSRLNRIVSVIVVAMLISFGAVRHASRVRAQAGATTAGTTSYTGIDLFGSLITNHSGTKAAFPVHFVVDKCTLGTDCAVTLAGNAVFSSSTSYQCAATDGTSAAAVKSAISSGTAVTFTGTSTDVIDYICAGN